MKAKNILTKHYDIKLAKKCNNMSMLFADKLSIR